MADLNDLAKKMNISATAKNQESKNKADLSNKKDKQETKRRTWLETPSQETIVLLNPTDILNWSFHDRPGTELGDIEALAKDFATIGQQQPCIVRPTPIGTKEKYELIIGERRWRAAQQANVELKVIIKELSDQEAALAQAAENDNRKDLSDYAKGIYYAKLIDSGILKQTDLIAKLNKSRQYISALLAFSQIPKEIIDAIGDMTKVSSRTAETIRRLANKGEDHISAIISKAASIRDGRLGNTSLPRVIDKIIDTKSNLSEKELNKKIYSSDGRHLFTIRQDNNHLPSIHFPKNIISLIKEKRINMNGIIDIISQTFEKELDNLKS